MLVRSSLLQSLLLRKVYSCEALIYLTSEGQMLNRVLYKGNYGISVSVVIRFLCNGLLDDRLFCGSFLQYLITNFFGYWLYDVQGNKNY